MKLVTKQFDRMNDERGATAITVAITATVLLGMAALAIDVGHALVTQTELQAAADAAALNAGRRLGVIYWELPLEEQQDMDRNLTGGEETQIEAAATNAAKDNSASDAMSLTIAQNDFQIGVWNFAAKTFTPGTVRPNAVRVTTRRDDVQNTPITTFFGGIFGVNEMSVSATATAALGTAGGRAPEGTADVPFAISQNWFNGVATCDAGIQFSPTGPDGCAGWHVFDQQPANAKKLRDTVDGLEGGTYTSPEIIPGQTQFEFTGGEVASAFPNLITLWNTKKEWNTSNSRYEWPINLPVYQASSPTSCDNPSGPITIVGYAKAVVTNVADKDIQAEVKCDAMIKADPIPDPTDNGGGNRLNPRAPFPRLVS